MQKTPMETWIGHKIQCAIGDGGVLTRAQIDAYQLSKLRETIALARDKSRFYTKTLAAFPPHAIHSFQDFAQLPFTTSDDLRQDSLRFLCTSQDDISRIVTLESSGTTGSPKRIYFTADDQELTIDFFHQALPGIAKPGDKVLILLPSERFGSVGGLFAESARRMGVQTVAHGLVNDPKLTLEIMEREQVNMLLGIPVQVLALASYESPRASYYRTHIENVILNTDHIPKALVQRLQDKWGCRVFNHYAMTEMGMAGGVECEAFAGLHLREADLLFEIINPETGEVLNDGEEGEVVFTTLTRKGMPLIRYRTGDISRFIPASCPCGTVLKRLVPVKERVGGGTVLANGELISMSMLDEALFAVRGLLNFQAEITVHGGMDRLDITAQVATWAGANIQELIRQALLSIRAIADHVHRGVLMLGSVVVDQTGKPWNPSKRIIRDLRK